MKTRDFCYWLKGFIELQDQYVTIKQWNTILEHLTLVKDNVENKNKLTQTEKTVFDVVGICTSC